MRFNTMLAPILLTIIIPLSSCSTPITPTKINLPTMTTEAQCIAGGGEWKRLTRGGKPSCNQTFSDAGKACNDGAVCESNTCLAPRDTAGVAQCAATTSAVIHAGCTGGKMVNGKVMPAGCP